MTAIGFFCHRFTTMPYRAPEMVSLYSGNTITTKADIWVRVYLCISFCILVIRNNAFFWILYI
jgi:hypothetical protein